MVTEIVKGCEAFGLGYQYVLSNGKHEEVAQGKNYYIASLYQTGEIAVLCGLIHEIATSIFQSASLTLSVLTSVIPIVWLPIGILLASIKQNDYPALISYFSNTLGRVFPKNLGERTIRICNFLRDHLSQVIKIGILVGVVSLAYFECYAYSGVFLATWAFHEIDQRGYLPRKISIFAERYFPMIASGCLLFGGGTILLQIIAGLNLITTLPLANRFATQKIDTFIRWISNKEGVSLAEFEAPLEMAKDFSFEKILNILNADAKHFRLNPAHCSKFVQTSFKKNYQFNEFLTLFNQVDWENKYNLVKSKLQNEERFRDFLLERFPGSDLKKDFEVLIQKLAKDKNITKEAFLTDWMREELTQLVKVLTDEIRPMGDQIDLEVGIENCAMILPYLKKPSLNKVNKEDLLLKLAVEGGGYCARGIKRASSEIFHETVVPSNEEDAVSDPQKIYERKIRQALQIKRRSIVEDFYLKIVRGIHNQVTKDVHGFDLYRKFLCLGFYPLTPLERDQIDLIELLVWEFAFNIQPYMVQDYQSSLDGVVHEVGESSFSQYIRQYIQNNSLLTVSQKQKLLKVYTERSGQWSPEETNERFHRLLLIKLGILKPLAA